MAKGQGLLTQTEFKRGSKAQHAAYQKRMKKSMRRARVVNLGMTPSMSQIYRGSTKAAAEFRGAKGSNPKGSAGRKRKGGGGRSRQRRDRNGKFA